MRAVWAAALLAATVAVTARLDAQSTYAADSTAIAAAARAFSAAYLRNDTLALAHAYVDSAIAFPPGRRAVAGPAAIGHLFAWPAGYRQLEHLLTIEHLQIQGDLAVDVGTWHSTGQREGKDPVAASGRYLVTWVRTSGGPWKILYDIWQPPPAN
jgi:ketosteroid isomerase-like protein